MTKVTSKKDGIETPNGTLTAVQVIWAFRRGNAHGTANEGWYLRCRYADGHDEHDRVDDLEDMAHDAADADLCRAAFDWVFPPDGINDDEMTVLRNMIEVRR
jgi:hypothetical protein